MRFFRETRIDFLGARRYAAILSAAVILVGLGSIVVKGGLRMGVDFAGGSQIIVRFAEPPRLDPLRSALAEAGVSESQIQEFDEADEVLIRAPGEAEQEDPELRGRVERALNAVNPPPAEAAGKLDLNTVGSDQIVGRLIAANPLEMDVVVGLEAARDQYFDVAEDILASKQERGLLRSWDDLEAAGVDPRVLSALKEDFYIGGHAIVGNEWVGPQVGQDLRRQAQQAIVWSLIGMLAYLSYRFDFKFGVAAVAALVHDVLVTMGAFSLTDREFNLPVIAAFLTIVGYSLNDTVVVFDRIRENSVAMRRASLYDRINTSVNQTLSRTILTSGTTLLVVLSLYLYGGQAINDFAFALLVGVIAGTYSTVFIANPVVYAWEQWSSRRPRKK